MLGFLAAALCRRGDVAWPRRLDARGVLAAAFALCLVTSWLAGTIWPNSGDEYSDAVLADTLASGHYATPSPADTLLFRTFHIIDLHGRRFSQYAPGWPLLLAPFRAAGLDALAPAGLAVCLGVALRSSLRSLRVARAVEAPALAMVLLTPFSLFNGASLFPHMLAAVLTASIVALALGDDATPRQWRKLAIGAAFGWLAITRAEAAMLVGGAYAVDRVWYRRGGAVVDLLLVAVGALPWLVWHGDYNAALTGSFWLDPQVVGTPDLRLGLWGNGYNGAHTPLRGLVHVLQWCAGLAAYGGWLPFALLPGALAARWAGRRLRFFDAIVPLAVLFFLAFPDDGGHQYGPRYWFFAWPVAVLSVVAGLVGEDGCLRVGRVVRFERVAAAQVMVAAGAWLALVPAVRIYINTRRAVFETAPAVRPAVVLVPQWWIEGGLWVEGTREQEAPDFARNPAGFAAPVLYGRGDLPDATKRACALGRAVYSWRPGGGLSPVACGDG